VVLLGDVELARTNPIVVLWGILLDGREGFPFCVSVRRTVLYSPVVGEMARVFLEFWKWAGP